MTEASDWDMWAGSWRSELVDQAGLEAFIAGTRRVRRAMVVTRGLSAIIAVSALLIVAAALQHAGSIFERALGSVVAAGIAIAWLTEQSDHKHALDKVESGSEEYATARRRLCRRRIRFAYFAWVVAALDMAFLIPWWIGGFAVHGGGFHAMQVLTLWLPIVLIVAFVVWAGILRRKAKRELILRA